MKPFLLLLVLSSLTYSSSFAQDTKSRKEKRQEKREKQYKEVELMIDSLNYVFDASKANPAGYKQIDLSSHTAYLKIFNDSVDAYLPFFGRAYSASYGGEDSGIEFKTKLTDYLVKKNVDKRNITITFSAKSKSDNYICTLTVTTKESATLFITSNKRASISFYGDILTNTK